MASKKNDIVPRPTKKSEYTLKFATRSAQKGWVDLVATQRNVMVETWGFLTKTPDQVTNTNYKLKGELGNITYQGRSYQRWQHQPTLKGSARIWFIIEGKTVLLVDVFSAHTNQTK